MGRYAQYNYTQFVDAALKIAAVRGPAAVTMAAIAQEVRAPIGSVYHRFLSRDILLAEVWLRVAFSFQSEFLGLLNKGDGLEAALYTPRWVRHHPAEARILLLYRREELAAGTWPDELKGKALLMKRTLDGGLRDYGVRMFGKYDQEAAGRTMFALVDVPYAAVIRYIGKGIKPPGRVDDYIRQTYMTIMGGTNEDRQLS